MNKVHKNSSINQSNSAGYALVGQGRLGKALADYFLQKSINFKVFDREYNSQLAGKYQAILLAISDVAIKSVFKNLHNKHNSIPFVHFSGTIQIPGSLAAHPLYSFTGRKLSLTEFESIPFILDPGEKNTFNDIFPNFKNPVFELSQKKGAQYHALCVCLGNLAQMIQNNAINRIDLDYALPKEALFPFLKSLLANLESQNNELISGPIARRDITTIEQHLKSLENSSPFLKRIYKLCVESQGITLNDSK